MAQTVNILPHAEDRKRLLAIVADIHRPLMQVLPAKIDPKRLLLFKAHGVRSLYRRFCFTFQKFTKVLR